MLIHLVFIGENGDQKGNIDCVRTFIWDLREQVMILGRQDRRGAGREVTFADRAAATQFLSPLLSDSSQMQSLRSLLAEETQVLRPLHLGDREVLDELGLALTSGDIHVELRPLPLPEVPVGSELAATEIPATPMPASENSWVEVLVFWAEGGQPVPSLRFKVKPAGGSPQSHSTNSDGKFRLDPIKAGDYELESDNSGAHYSNTIIGTVGAAPPGPPRDGAAASASRGSTEYKLIDLRKHKVKTGDTLESVAKQFSTTWQDLAKYNWGTDEPAKVNRHLRWDVGCSKKTKDGKNYVFDDSDDPGVIFVPEKWKLKERTGHQVVLLVRKAETTQPWLFSM